MEHEGHRQRMRDRFLKQGLEGFAPHEVLELMLFYAIPQKNVNPLAHDLLEKFGSLHSVLEAEPRRLCQVKGIGEYAAAFLSLFAPVARYAQMEKAGERVTLATRQKAEDYCVKLLEGERREVFYAICLNGQMQVLYSAMIARGSLTNVPAYPRLVVEAALLHNAHSVMLCHNHPGGSLIPSQEDVEVTRRLGAVLQGMDITLIDHMIVADGKALSMVASRLIRQESSPEGLSNRAADSSGGIRSCSKLPMGEQKAE
ncbi:MAG: DNA repair protein RadC [Clostridiales bacterium]|nr:DNA repair protein RadC [Clostridiales bacterium]